MRGDSSRIDTDHYLIRVTVDLNATILPPRPKHNFSKTDWQAFSKYIYDSIEHFPPFNTQEEIDQAAAKLTEWGDQHMHTVLQD